ncbi:deazaflavin-dependent nitroreductase [Kribbella sp. NPDC050124]|uniref:deazaflavin-dependent nitroreductase n=1 Tax=Kribbella sp. NPDC050124 TaxID=3364114 RepID=UPI0037950037
MATSRRNSMRDRLIVLLHRAGLAVGPTQLLTVVGRISGRPHTTPIAPVTVDGVPYIVQAYPDANWVKNARAAGHGVLTRGLHRCRVELIEVPKDQRGPILREFPLQNPRGARAFVRNGLVRSASPDSFAAAAPRCTIFRATPRTAH